MTPVVAVILDTGLLEVDALVEVDSTAPDGPLLTIIRWAVEGVSMPVVAMPKALYHDLTDLALEEAEA